MPSFEAVDDDVLSVIAGRSDRTEPENLGTSGFDASRRPGMTALIALTLEPVHVPQKQIEARATNICDHFRL